MTSSDFIVELRGQGPEVCEGCPLSGTTDHDFGTVTCFGISVVTQPNKVSLTASSTSRTKGSLRLRIINLFNQRETNCSNDSFFGVPTVTQRATMTVEN